MRFFRLALSVIVSAVIFANALVLPARAQTVIPAPSAAAAASAAPAVGYDPTKPTANQAIEIIKAGEQKAFIWEVKSASNTVFLFGTIHVGKKSFYPLPASVESAFKRSGKLVLEADISKTDDNTEINKLIAYTPPDSLEKHLPAALTQRLKQQLARLKLPQKNVNQMKPFLVGGLLSLSEFSRLGYDMNDGVEGYLLGQARENNKPVLELESQLGQIKMLNDMSPVLQEAFLDNALAALETGKTSDQIDGMVSAWQNGDAKLIQDVTAEATKGARWRGELDEILLYRRHPDMLKKIEDYLAEDQAHAQAYFVAVGSMHLVGPRGLIEMLAAKGYRIRQL